MSPTPSSTCTRLTSICARRMSTGRAGVTARRRSTPYLRYIDRNEGMFTTPTSATTIVMVSGMTIEFITVEPSGSIWSPSCPMPFITMRRVGRPTGTMSPEVSRTTIRVSARNIWPQAAAGSRRAGGSVVAMSSSLAGLGRGNRSAQRLGGEREEGVVERGGVGAKVGGGVLVAQQGGGHVPEGVRRAPDPRLAVGDDDVAHAGQGAQQRGVERGVGAEAHAVGPAGACDEAGGGVEGDDPARVDDGRSEEHTSELQSRGHLVCRLLLEK